MGTVPLLPPRLAGGTLAEQAVGKPRQARPPAGSHGKHRDRRWPPSPVTGMMAAS